MESTVVSSQQLERAWFPFEFLNQTCQQQGASLAQIVPALRKRVVIYDSGFIAGPAA